MQLAVVCGGKIGDILSCAAIAQSVGATDFVTSKRYEAIAQGIPGLKIHTYEGEWDQLRTAITYAKKKFPKVLVPQSFGSTITIQHSRPSFQLDQCARANVDIEKMRLTINRTPLGDILAGKLLPSQRCILLADQSESSPFEQRDALFKLLQDKFGSTHTIVRLSDIKLEDFKDFVHLYDAADALITIDTAHLHLSLASSVPTLAFITDRPNRWRGSAWHPRFKFCCRYGDFEIRKSQFLHALSMVIEGREWPALELIDTPNHTYNPSIIDVNGARVIAYRYHPDPLLWPTLIAVNGQNIKLPAPINDGYSIDDPRLFLFQGKLWMSYVFTKYPVPLNTPPPCFVGYGELRAVEGNWELVSHRVVKYGNNGIVGASQKNWVFFELNEKLYCIYQCSPEHIVLEVQGESVVREHRTKSPMCSFGEMRGGTQPVPHNGLWLRFFHTLVKKPNTAEYWWQYYCGALLMESTPPFTIVAVSKSPILSGNERYFHDWKFYKCNVTIAYGAVKHGDSGWLVSVGINDSACGLAHIKPEHLNL